MSSKLPFNNGIINGETVATSAFVYGSGTLTKTGDDIRPVTTADHVIRRYRRAINESAEMILWGDLRTTLMSDPGLPSDDNVVLKQDSDTVSTFTGVVTVDYDDNTRTSRVSIAGTPTFS